MSSTSTVTSYEITFALNGNNAQDNGQISLSSLTGVTDTVAAAVVAALQNVAWPAGATPSVTVQKVTNTNVLFQTDTATNPVTFT